MEAKKSKKAEIERHRSTWLLMGVVTVLSFMFVSFEWGQFDKQIDTSMAVKDLILDVDFTPITIHEQPLPPPPPAAVAVETFTLTDNESKEPDGTLAGTEITDAGIPYVYIPPISDEKVPVELPPVDFAEIMPEYPGGFSALATFLSKNVKYPSMSIEVNSQGRVIVQFVVDKDGSITHAQVVKGVDPHLDKEALRVINAMPKWSPGKQGGKAVRVKYTVPVTFKLQ